MKVAFFTDTFFPQVNGVVNVVHHLAEALSNRGNDVSVFTVSKEKGATIEQRPGIHYRVVTAPSLPMLIYPGERMTIPVGWSLPKVRSFKPDIIHTHTPFAMGREAALCARRLKVPLVGTHPTFFDHYLQLGHLDFQWARRLTWKMTNSYYNKCAVVVSPTHALARAMLEHDLHTPVEVIPNPVPLANFIPQEIRQSKKESTVAYMGRISREKDIDKVLEAFAHIRKQGTVLLRLIIIGDGPHKAVLEDKATDLGIREYVTFTGFLRGTALAEEIRAHDVFVTASKSENMPVSVLEAMASGLPIVAVEALGMPEIVRHGTNGFLVPPDDVGAMASRIIEIAGNPTIQKAFGAASRELALLHDPDLIAARHEELYNKLIPQK